MPGPIRKRDAERRRRNKDGAETLVVNLDETLAEEIEIPAPPLIREVKNDETGEMEELDEPISEWHPVAENWYLSLTKSGQAIFYEASDWSMAYLLADQIHQALQPRPVQTGTDDDGKPTYTYMVVPMPGSTLNAIIKGSSMLMAMEGARRQLRIELDRKKRRDAAIEGDGVVVSITQNRADVFKRGARG